MKLKKAFVKIYQILVFGVPVLYLMFMIALGIMTQIAYSRFGVYPDADELFSALAGANNGKFLTTDSGWSTVAGGSFLYLAFGFMVYGYTMSCIMNIIEGREREKAKGIIPLLAGFGFVGFMAFYMCADNAHMLDGMKETERNLLAGIPIILFIVIAIWALRKSCGGMYMLITLALLAAHLFILPVILWFASLSTIGKIGAVIAAVVVVGLCFMASIKSGITKREAFAQIMSENSVMSYSDAFDLAGDILPDPDAIAPGQ